MKIDKLVGVVLFAAATAAIWLWPAAKPPAPLPEAVRPVRSVVVDDDKTLPDLKFAGTVKAKDSRTLAFKRSGRIERIPVKKSQRVKSGETLAWLFRDDFENDLAAAEAAAERARLTFRRTSDAAKKNAVSKEELSRAEADKRQAEAALELAKRALAEATLVAPFDGEIADVIATELDMVGPSDDILVLQDRRVVHVEVAMPENLVILSGQIECNCEGAISVTFDSYPGEAFPAKFVEFATTADSKTQTFLATYEIAAPTNLTVLPGMSATLNIAGRGYRFASTAANDYVLAPAAAVGVGPADGHFVWTLVETDKAGVYVARRRAVRIAGRVNDLVEIEEGLKAGERVATAGVAVLTEGREVSLLAD